MITPTINFEDFYIDTVTPRSKAHVWHLHPSHFSSTKLISACGNLTRHPYKHQSCHKDNEYDYLRQATEKDLICKNCLKTFYQPVSNPIWHLPKDSK